MLWAFAEETSVSAPVAVSRSYTVVSVFLFVCVCAFVELVVEYVVVNVVVVADCVDRLVL